MNSIPVKVMHRFYPDVMRYLRPEGDSVVVVVDFVILSCAKEKEKHANIK